MNRHCLTKSNFINNDSRNDYTPSCTSSFVDVPHHVGVACPGPASLQNVMIAIIVLFMMGPAAPSFMTDSAQARQTITIWGIRMWDQVNTGLNSRGTFELPAVQRRRRRVVAPSERRGGHNLAVRSKIFGYDLKPTGTKN